MSSKRRLKWLSTMMLSAVVSSFVAPVLSADNVELSVVPDKCISLLKGQVCYQRVQFRWTSKDISDIPNPVCLWREGDSVALKCWGDATEGTYRYRLEAANTTSFHLAGGNSPQPVLVSTTVKISWVYNNRESRRSRWRLF